MIGTTLAAGRRAIEAQMVDTCVIARMIHSQTIDEHTGQYVVTPTTIYAGPCKFKIAFVRVRDIDSQGQDLSVADGILSIPIGAAGSIDVQKDDVATIRVATNDTVTTTGVVQAQQAPTFATARRLFLEITQ